ncbi:hypothetical protein Tco_0479226 [Tanacetum coccineum]
MAENIIIISDSNSGSSNSSHSNNNSHLNNNSDSFGSTSSLISWYGEISTSEEYVHSSPDIVYSKGPSNSLLNWYEDLSDEYKERFWCSKSGGNKTNAKPSFSKAIASPKASGSKTMASPKTLIVKSPILPTMSCAEEKKGKRKIIEIIVLSSNSFDYSKGVPEEEPSVASVPVEGPSIQGLLDWYGYNTIEEYLSDTYFGFP